MSGKEGQYVGTSMSAAGQDDSVVWRTRNIPEKGKKAVNCQKWEKCITMNSASSRENESNVETLAEERES